MTTITKGLRDLLKEADSQVRAYSVKEVCAMNDNKEITLIDIRDIRELEREGVVPDAIHVPRGMLEFWFAPDSPYYRDALGKEDTTYVLFCAGGLRSALGAKALQDMGMTNIAHMTGGFGAWRKDNQPVNKT